MEQDKQTKRKVINFNDSSKFQMTKEEVVRMPKIKIDRTEVSKKERERMQKMLQELIDKRNRYTL